MATYGTDKVTVRQIQVDGSSLFTQHQIDHEQIGGTVTDQISVLSVGQATLPADPGRIQLVTNNATYTNPNAGYLPPPGGYATATPEPSGAVVEANQAARGF